MVKNGQPDVWRRLLINELKSLERERMFIKVMNIEGETTSTACTVNLDYRDYRDAMVLRNFTMNYLKHKVMSKEKVEVALGQYKIYCSGCNVEKSKEYIKMRLMSTVISEEWDSHREDDQGVTQQINNYGLLSVG